MTLPLAGFKALSFDCYGTLIDWETGIWEASRPLFETDSARAPSPAELLAAFSEIEPAVEEKHGDALYREILTRTHRELASRFGVDSTPELDTLFGDSVGNWPAFDDSPDALAYLKQHFHLVILSNIDRTSFAASNARLGVEFDAIYTAEDIGTYKPDRRNFDYLVEHLEDDLGIEKHQVLHVAQSLFHDHAPAKHLGFTTAWIDRQRLSEGGDWGATTRVENPPQPDYVFFSMAEFADAVAAEFGDHS